MADIEKKQETNREETRKQALWNGLWVLIILAVLTAGEYIVAVIAPPWGAILLLAALFKAYYVVRDYMHVSRLFAGEEEAH